ncbi:MAG TPA: thiamine pyrophosphate-dependent enzyme [Chloroflexota bacterium]|jgi:thiamine pyrophosphate-dependent acetolactate synthase large subunit-like protein|nr:thiamine pyrophosphate-dependent enzyme [Chloroflexota bacterium]
MQRTEFLAVFARHRGAAVVIVGPGIASREVFALAHTEATLYQMEMAYATPLCLGLALAKEDSRAIAIEGDGSILAGLGVLTTIGRYQPPNLTLIILDNGLYSTIESRAHPAIESATAAGTDLADVARACGIQRVVTVWTVAEADEALQRAVREPGPWVIVAKVPHIPPESDPRAATPPDLFENSLSFARAVYARAEAAD